MASPESEAIPYQALNLRGERLLVLAPHPDDEVIGCGGVVFQHLRDGREVRVAVATDGVAAAPGEDRDAYRVRREDESRHALPGAAFDFFRFPDRALDAHAGDLGARLRDVLDTYRPDLILVPGAIEIHPDHLALARSFCELIQRDGSLFADLAVARVAFYEVGQPLRPNVLVDITGVAAAKYDAIAAHSSQTEIRDYVSFARGLNAYRAMTLAPEVRFAEGYWVASLPALRTTAFSALRNAMGAPPPLAVSAEPKPISVVIRTKNRPALLREAVDSVRATGYPAEIVIVNDGGARVDMDAGMDGVKLIEHQTSRGRSEAANAGVRAASSELIVFLDDDDLMYPEHLPALAAGTAPCYTDAVSAFAHSRMRIYSRDFDRELLLIDNYIPLPTVLIRRADFLELGGFDPAFDLFEDWDFLIRLAQRAAFTHIPRVTCEIRHIEGSGSITMSTPAGSPRFREAKLQIWRKHAALIDHDTIAGVFEREKQRALAIENELVEAKGLRGHFEQNLARLERDAARLEGDKAALIGELQRQSERLNEATVRIGNLEGANEELRTALGLAQKERNELLVKVGELGDARGAFDEAQRTIAALYTEIGRLQTTLDAIMQSRTWKLHAMVEKMKGRG